MFIGHYGPAFGAKAAVKTVPLWLLFVAVQFLDYCWSVLVLLGIEKGKVVPGFTQASPLDLYFMPYTHGLIGASALSILFGIVAMMFYRENRVAVFLVCALSVFSHWLCDLLVHVADMPLWDDTDKVGFGLWRNIWISLPLELGLLLIGAWFYQRFVPGTKARNIALWLFVLLMTALELYNEFGPPPATIQMAAEMALLAYTVLALLAGAVDMIGPRTARVPAQ